MYGGKMCGTVTPPSADCELIILLPSNNEEGRAIIQWEESILAPQIIYDQRQAWHALTA
jgi:hypothetical protein